MSSKDKLGDRMKKFYEDRSQTYLPRRTYTMIRLDGKSFHTFTKRFKKPFDEAFMSMMDACAFRLCKEVQGCKLAYVQSDEISLVLTDFDRLETDAWFDNNVQKMCSVSASIFSAVFNKLYTESRCRLEYDKEEGYENSVVDKRFEPDTLICCDSRVWTIPTKDEVINYFIWRQQDATRNSISSVAHSMYSTKELHGKSSSQQHEMMFQKGINWDKLPVAQKRGRTVIKDENGDWMIDHTPPIFSINKTYLTERIL